MELYVEVLDNACFRGVKTQGYQNKLCDSIKNK